VAPGDTASKWALGLSIAGFFVPLAAVAGLIAGYQARSTNAGRNPDVARRAQRAIVIGWVALAVVVLFYIIVIASAG
jgi:hypothetical protein